MKYLLPGLVMAMMIFPMNSANGQHSCDYDEAPTMSSIEDYRRQLNQQVTAERDRNSAPSWGTDLERLGGQEVLGAPRGDATDLETLIAAVVGPNMNPDPAFRATALGQIVLQSDDASAPQLPLERLADAQEDVQVRQAALGILQLLSISSPTFAEWRPTYLEALRSVIEVPELQLKALDILIAHGDRHAQERLVAGLENPDQALVAPADALNLLSEDTHADVRVLAREFVDKPIDDRTLEAAIRHLAGDPESVGRLQSVIRDQQQSIATRRLAALALSSLSPEALSATLDTLETPAAEAEANSDPVVDFVRILVERQQSK